MTGFYVMLAMASAFAILAAVFAGMWVYRDAKQRSLPAGAWTLVVVFTGIFLGLILYLLIGRSREGAPQHTPINRHTGLLVGLLVSMAGVFVSLAICLYFYFSAGGAAF